LPVDTSAWASDYADRSWFFPSWSPNGRYLSWKMDNQVKPGTINIVIQDTQTNEVHNFYTEPGLDL